METKSVKDSQGQGNWVHWWEPRYSCCSGQNSKKPCHRSSMMYIAKSAYWHLGMPSCLLHCWCFSAGWQGCWRYLRKKCQFPSTWMVGRARLKFVAVVVQA